MIKTKCRWGGSPAPARGSAEVHQSGHLGRAPHLSEDLATVRHTGILEHVGNDPRRIIATILDLEIGRARVLRSDMKELDVPLDISRFASTDRIATFTYFPHLNGLHCVTKLGDEILAECPSLDSPSPRDGRIAVYLDQKDWRTLRDARFQPEAIQPAEEREAADLLMRSVEERRVILPFSSGHLTETTKWRADPVRRYQLGLTILQLSRGWQLRDPLAVREGEIRAALAHRGQANNLSVPNVVTLEPNAALAGRSKQYRPSTHLPADHALATSALASLAACFSTMLDEEAIEPIPVRGWGQRQQQLSDLLAEARPDRQAADKMLNQFFIADTAYEIARAAQAVGITRSQLDAWIEHGTGRDVPLMPSLGLFREILRERHLNGRNTWEQNDLTDMAYLTCAAGYADHVVGERHFTHHLSRAAVRLGRDVSVHRNLRQLMSRLEGAGKLARPVSWRHR